MHLITGEYPPDLGGVADFTAALAAAMTVTGSDVHIWCSGTSEDVLTMSGTLHRRENCFRIETLQRLSRELDRFPRPRTLLVQYVPHAFGWKAMNVPFCLWLLYRRWCCGDDVRTLFHEVAFPFVRKPLRHNVLAIVTRVMAGIVVAASRRIYVSTTAWNPHLDAAGGRRVPREWTPIPSNVPTAPQSEASVIRRRLTNDDPDAVVVGNFGAATGAPQSSLFAVARRLLAECPTTRILFVGRDSERLCQALQSTLPGDRVARVAASSATTLPRLAAHIQACDVAVQPFVDGMSSRRTSGMAWLANGVPMVTNHGELSESLWTSDRPTPMAGRLDADELFELASGLVRNPAARAAAGRRGREYYEANFSLERTVRTLLATGAGA